MEAEYKVRSIPLSKSHKYFVFSEGLKPVDWRSCRDDINLEVGICTASCRLGMRDPKPPLFSFGHLAFLQLATCDHHPGRQVATFAASELPR